MGDIGQPLRKIEILPIEKPVLPTTPTPEADRSGDPRENRRGARRDRSDLEPVVGVYGLRTFRVSLDGNLLPLTQLSNDWAGGRCVARCAVGGEHTAPETGCTCGIYSFRDLVHLAKQFAAAHSLVAVVALEGATVEGDRGWRSQAAQVVAVWIADDALPSHLRTALLERLPGVREHSSPEKQRPELSDLRIATQTYDRLHNHGARQPCKSNHLVASKATSMLCIAPRRRVKNKWRAWNLPSPDALHGAVSLAR